LSAAVGVDLPAAQRRRALALCTVRCVLSSALLLTVYFLLPVGGFEPGLSSLIVLSAGAAVFVVIFAWHVRSITRAAHPRLRAAEALVLSILLFIVIFSLAYVGLSDTSPSSFSEPLDHVGGLYFTIATLGTVGYGDIVPKSELARILVASQVLLDLAFVAVTVRTLLSASRRSLSSRTSGGDSGQ